MYFSIFFSQVIKSKATVEDSDDDEVEVIMSKAAGKTRTSTEDQETDQVCSEVFLRSFVHALNESFAQMEVDDDKKASHDIGTVPKGLSFKKSKPNPESTSQDQPESSIQVRTIYLSCILLY